MPMAFALLIMFWFQPLSCHASARRRPGGRLNSASAAWSAALPWAWIWDVEIRAGAGMSRTWPM